MTLVVSDADPATPNPTVTAIINPTAAGTTADLSNLSDGPLSVTAMVTDARQRHDGERHGRVGYERRHHRKPG